MKETWHVFQFAKKEQNSSHHVSMVTWSRGIEDSRPGSLRYKNHSKRDSCKPEPVRCELKHVYVNWRTFKPYNLMIDSKTSTKTTKLKTKQTRQHVAWHNYSNYGNAKYGKSLHLFPFESEQQYCKLQKNVTPKNENAL